MTGKNLRTFSSLKGVIVAFRILACKNVLAMAFVCAVGGSFVVANLRERVFHLRANYANAGWPLLAVSLETKVTMSLIDGDFTGEEDEAANIPASPQKTWTVLRESHIVLPLYLAVNPAVAVCVVLATIIMTNRWRRCRSTVSLLGIFLWITCVGILHGYSRVTEVEVAEAFWSLRSLRQIDWKDTVCFTFIAAGCTCAIYCVFRSFGQTRPDEWQGQ